MSYPFVQFLVDSILFFVFKLPIRKAIRIENYIFLSILIVSVLFFLLIQITENKVNFQDLKILLLTILGSFLFITIPFFIYKYTQKKRVKKLEKLLGNL